MQVIWYITCRFGYFWNLMVPWIKYSKLILGCNEVKVVSNITNYIYILVSVTKQVIWYTTWWYWDISEILPINPVLPPFFTQKTGIYQNRQRWQSDVIQILIQHPQNRIKPLKTLYRLQSKVQPKFVFLTRTTRLLLNYKWKNTASSQIAWLMASSNMHVEVIILSSLKSPMLWHANVVKGVSCLNTGTLICFYNSYLSLITSFKISSVSKQNNIV